MNAIIDTKAKVPRKGSNSSTLRKKIIEPNSKQSYVVIQDKASRMSKENCQRAKHSGGGISRKSLDESKIYSLHQTKSVICRNLFVKGTINKVRKSQLPEIKGSLVKENHGSSKINTSNTSTEKETPPKVNSNVAEVKKKFLSRQYLDNSKYEKIEGLNWISWK